MPLDKDKPVPSHLLRLSKKKLTQKGAENSSTMGKPAKTKKQAASEGILEIVGVGVTLKDLDISATQGGLATRADCT